MALINLDNKKQIVIILFAVGLGVTASILVGSYTTAKINEETRKLAYQYEKVQKQKQQEHQEQMAFLTQRIAEVEETAKRAAAEAVQVAAQKQAEQAAATTAKKKISLASRTPAGKRAITVMINSLDAVGGLLNPGDFVDVIAHLDIPGGKKDKNKEGRNNITAMIFQNIKVLAVNTNLDDPGAYDQQQSLPSLKVTFAVDPQEAGLLLFAEKNGKLDLVLRGQTEKGRSMLPAASWATLAEYVLENTGADIKAPEQEESINLEVETENVTETKPYIQIYRAGREL